MRATNLQELVYKNGQAGITKATVSITFDNADKKQSPLGYEQYDEITITRQVCLIYTRNMLRFFEFAGVWGIFLVILLIFERNWVLPGGGGIWTPLPL